jgi:hypothetical protein
MIPSNQGNDLCENCKKPLGSNPIILKRMKFCSDICHLTFWKNEMPNLGGRLILDTDLEKLDKLHGQERHNFYQKVVDFILNNLETTAFMLNVRYSEDPYK